MALLGLAACMPEQREDSGSAGLEERMLRADPLHPDFLTRLEAGEGLFECLLSIDRFLCPDLDPSRVRSAFDSISAQADLALARLHGGPSPFATAEEAARAFLRTLDARGFVYGTSPGSSDAGDPKMISGALVDRRGCCASFSLLLMAYLDRIGMRSSIVCLPDHCFVRVEQGNRSLDVEATDFESPLRKDYVNSLEFAGSDRSGHYGRSLDPEQTLWHYYVDRLWTWSRWRCTDEFSLQALARARAILGSSCQSIEAQEAHVAEDRRRAAQKESFVRYQNLNRIHPAEPDYVAALEKLGPSTSLVKETRAQDSLQDSSAAPAK
jgi:hypothetical protein